MYGARDYASGMDSEAVDKPKAGQSRFDWCQIADGLIDKWNQSKLPNSRLSGQMKAVGSASAESIKACRITSGVANVSPYAVRLSEGIWSSCDGPLSLEFANIPAVDAVSNRWVCSTAVQHAHARKVHGSDCWRKSLNPEDEEIRSLKSRRGEDECRNADRNASPADLGRRRKEMRSPAQIERSERQYEVRAVFRASKWRDKLSSLPTPAAVSKAVGDLPASARASTVWAIALHLLKC